MNRFWSFLHFYMEKRVIWGYNRRGAAKDARQLSAPVEESKIRSTPEFPYSSDSWEDLGYFDGR